MSSVTYRKSVDYKPGISCCAQICNASDVDRKFLFRFPPASNTNGRKRCQLWVRKAGNVELLKYRLTELESHFYLCSSHFQDWIAASDNSHRTILSTAVPVNFDFPPLKREIINIAFNESSELEKEYGRTASKETSDEPLVEAKQSNGGSESENILAPEWSIIHENHQTDKSCIPMQGDVNDTKPQNHKIDENTQTSIANYSNLVTKKNDTESITISSDSDSVPNKNNNEIQADESISELAQINDKLPEESSSILDTSVEKHDQECHTKEKSVSVSPLTSSSDQAALANLTPKSDSVAQSENVVVKKEVITDDHVDSPSLQDATNSSIQETDISETSATAAHLTPTERTSRTPRKNKKILCGNKRETSKRKAKSDACDRLSGKFQEKPDTEDDEPVRKVGRPRKTVKQQDPRIEQELTRVARSFIVSKDILSKVGSKLGLQTSPPPHAQVIDSSPIITNVYSTHPLSPKKLSTPVISNIRSLLPQYNRMGKSVSVVKAPKTYRGSKTLAESVEPILRTTATQTSIGSFDQSHKFLTIIDTDRKLCVLSGIPSFEVLERITDTTLKMVMSEAMRSEMQPTMREWIIVACTKFMLNISIEALAVMFELAADECSRIVEKTSLFLRRTLSSPDGQKYVWSLPTEVLNGIADFSDGSVNI